MAARRKNARKSGASRTDSKRGRASKRASETTTTTDMGTPAARGRAPWIDDAPRRGPEYERQRREAREARED